jgi:hypothetical protein
VKSGIVFSMDSIANGGMTAGISAGGAKCDSLVSVGVHAGTSSAEPVGSHRIRFPLWK